MNLANPIGNFNAVVGTAGAINAVTGQVINASSSGTRLPQATIRG